MKKLLLIIVFMLFSMVAQAAGFDHDVWDGLLKKHVVPIREGHATQLNYRGMAKERALLKKYLLATSQVGAKQFAAWSKAEQLAFLINAYNAWTVELVLTGYPNIESIKDLGSFFQSPWKKRFIPLLGETRSLDDIEHGLIRAEGSYQEPRIHFAVNCASIGCPALRAEAYRGEWLNHQLEQATQLFLSDRSRNRLEGDTLKLSKIFDWYGEDFEFPAFFIAFRKALGLTGKAIQQLQKSELDMEYLDYDWRLNTTP